MAQKMAGPAQYEQLAGQAIEDVDRQFAGQARAQQIRMSRMGLDPSQQASVTGGRQERIAQAVARAGAMQSARRQAEVNQAQAQQTMLQHLGGMAQEQRQARTDYALAQLREGVNNPIVMGRRNVQVRTGGL